MGFQSQVVTLLPDSNWRNPANDPFSGYAFVESWQGETIHRYKFVPGAILMEPPASNETGSSNKIAASNPKQTDVLIANCGTISGYNYGASDPNDLYSWTEPAGCDYSYIADPEGPGLKPGQIPQLARPTIPLATIVIEPPSNIIGNISDYLKCFSNYGGSDHTYTVTVCVDQPVPGSRTPWALTSGGPSGSTNAGNPIQTGHTFLVLSENFSDHSIVRNVGFYPQTVITPLTPSAQGQLNDDEGHGYDIALTLTVDNGQFFNILNYLTLGNNPGFMYNLNTDNCTTFDLSALAAAGINLPSTMGSWVGGGFGYDPGDLGEDIRSMSLSSNMTRSTVSNAHPNQYNCN